MYNERNYKRCYDVFFFEPDESVYDINFENGQLLVFCISLKDGLMWVYKPDMTERPHALAYILGEREDFDD